MVWRHMVILGPESQRAAEASECAAEQDRFWDYHDRLFRSQAGENRGAFSDANLKRLAADLSLDTAAFNACLDSGRTRAQVVADTEAGRQKGVRSTPTIFVNDQKLEGVPRFDTVRQLVETLAAGARTPAATP
jgi:protein-disulfide isomerase